MRRLIAPILVLALVLPTLFMLPPPVQASVYDYEIISVTQAGSTEVTVKLQVQFCSACNPNYLSSPGCFAFTHGYPPPYYPYSHSCGGLIDGRYVAVRVKDEAGNILGTQKLVCNQVNWPIDQLVTRDFMFSGIPPEQTGTVIAEADVYCSWCGHWYPSPKSLQVAPLRVVIDPGHDPVGKPLEYAINKGVADKLQDKLQGRGIAVSLTNSNDDITARATYVNGLKPDAFVSLHCNALEGFNNGIPIGTAVGREVWAYDDTDSARQAAQETDLADYSLARLTQRSGSIFFYPTGTDELGDYTGWLERDAEHGGFYEKGYYHIGHDIAAAVNTNVYAIADGEVIYIDGGGSWNKNPTDGNIGIFIKHKLNDGTEFLALYGHVHSNLKTGDNVTGGKSFATIGPWGNTPHLHFGICPGTTPPPTNKNKKIGWGMMGNAHWPDTNGFVDPIQWITSNSPAPNEARKPIPKEKQSPWPSGIPILRGVTVCPAVLHEMEFYDYFGALIYRGVTYENMLELMNSDAWREDAAQGIAEGIVGYLEQRCIAITARCPVDLVVTDPDGLRICKDFTEIPGASYLETDINGEPGVQIKISEIKTGDYAIEVLPRPGALPTDTFTLEVSWLGESFTIAHNVMVSDIPADPYIVTLAETGIVPPAVPAELDFDPDVLNLSDPGKVVTAYIELPPDYDVSQIGISSIRLNGIVPALAKPTQIGDYDADGIPDLMVKFNGAAVKNMLAPGDHVEIAISGEVAGILFEGTDTIQVIDPTRRYLTISSIAGGSVTNPGEGTFTYRPGPVVSLVAEAEEGYCFVNWTGDVATVANVSAASTTITMNGNYRITANFAMELCSIYYADVAYPNLWACFYTNGQGEWSPDIANSFYEIGVLEIVEDGDIHRVEFYGRGCVYPATLTCNGVTKEAHCYHDFDPDGRYCDEVIAFDVDPTQTILAYTTTHTDEDNHGFLLDWVKVFYTTARQTSKMPERESA